MNFKYFLPTNIFFGQDCIVKNAETFDKSGKKAVIVTGKKSARLNGSEKDVRAALDSRGIPFVLFNEVESNPSIETVRKAAELSRNENADFVIGIGGGSPLDAAKAIAVLINNDVNDDELFSGKYLNPVAPVIAVPTTAGTGSEVTPYAILTDKKIENKKNLSTPLIFPAAAFLDAKYTESLPLNVTVNTAIDLMSHSVEGYLASRANSMSRMYSIESLNVFGECIPALTGKAELNIKIREKLLYASMMAGIVIAHTGTTVVHAMGYPLTYFRKIEHGRANGLLMHEYLKFISSMHPDKVKILIHELGLADIKEFGNLMDMLLGEKEILSRDEIEKFSSVALQAGSISNTDPVPKIDDIKKIFTSSFPG